MDYRQLLKEYMRIIRFAEGGDYIPATPDRFSDIRRPPRLTIADLDELEGISEELTSEIKDAPEGFE